MKCAGVGQPPKTLYKNVHHYRLRNGRGHQQSGQGECPHCGACHAVKARISDGRTYMVHHQNIRTCSAQSRKDNARRKRFWLTRYEMNRFQGDWRPLSVWGGTTATSVSVVETVVGVSSMTTGSGQSWFARPGSEFRIELHSNTSIQGNYIFQFNDQTMVAPQERITLAVDYASWTAWNNSITVSSNARIQSNQNWHNWITMGTVGNSVIAPVYNQRRQRGQQWDPLAYTAPREDPVSAAERRQRQAEALFQRVEAENKAKEVAQQTAHEMLLSLLTPEQRKEYQERKHFHIRGSNGTLYRILHGSSGNVRQVLSEADESRGLHGFCAHPRMSTDRRLAEEAGLVAGYLPHEDAMIAQMFALMTDEDQFLAVANRHW